MTYSTTNSCCLSFSQVNRMLMLEVFLNLRTATVCLLTKIFAFSTCFRFSIHCKTLGLLVLLLSIILETARLKTGHRLPLTCGTPSCSWKLPISIRMPPPHIGFENIPMFDLRWIWWIVCFDKKCYMKNLSYVSWVSLSNDHKMP